jgi:hypothetical protein
VKGGRDRGKNSGRMRPREVVNKPSAYQFSTTELWQMLRCDLGRIMRMSGGVFGTWKFCERERGRARET